MKNFFYFNKGQRIGVLILLLLIVFAFLATVLMPIFVKKDEIESGEDFLREAMEFRANLIENERSKSKETDFFPFEYRSYPKYKPTQTKYELFTFNPNTADSATFVKLGLKPYIARNVLRYREKGGSFRNADAFARVYGITPEKYEELKPFIQIPELENEKQIAENISEKPGNTNETADS